LTEFFEKIDAFDSDLKKIIVDLMIEKLKKKMNEIKAIKLIKKLLLLQIKKKHNEKKLNISICKTLCKL
jgi:hypothetical protein